MALQVADLGGGVRRLTLERLDRRNAIDAGLLDELEAALKDCEGVRCWIIAGAGEAFCAGYDITSLTDYGPTDPLPDTRLGDVFDRLSHHPAPSIAYLNGPAVGAGVELACACDFRIGSSKASFLLPPAKLGVVYAPRGVQRIARVAGLQTARWMLLTARKVGLDEALRLRLLDDQGDANALALAREIAAHAPKALGGMKRVLAQVAQPGWDPTELERLESLRREAFNSDEAKEGRAAFLQRRPPIF